LRDVKTLGRAAEVQFFREDHEALQSPKIHIDL
jgi:hypothetical protein